MLYPVHWLLLPLAPGRMQSTSLVVHVVIATVGMYGFARAALRVTPAASAVAASGFVVSGFVHAHIGHYEQVTSLAWLPWALWAADRAVTATSWRAATRPTVGLGAALALAALAGHTQYLYMSIAAVGLYAVAVARPIRRVAWIVAGVALGVALAAAQLLPTLAVSNGSLRAGGLSLAAASEDPLPSARR